MKFLKSFLMFTLLFCLFAAGWALAQTATPVPVDGRIATGDFLQALLAAIGSPLQAGAIGLAALVTQLAMKLLQSPLGDMAGKWRLLLVIVLSLASGIFALKMTGATWIAAILDGGTLAAVQVLVHQIYVQFIQKANEGSTTAPSA